MQLNAAHAIAIRYADDATVAARIERRVRGGANAIDQAFALLCLGRGWPNWPALPALLQWARAQITPELRVCALHLLREAAGGTFDHLSAAEERWFGGFLRHEGLRPREHWQDLAIPFVQHSLAGQPAAARFVLETLSGNGQNGGDRSMAWLLACTTFSEETEIKSWVADELEHPDRHGLILHNLSAMPESWLADPAFARSAAVTIRDEARSLHSTTTSSPSPMRYLTTRPSSCSCPPWTRGVRPVSEQYCCEGSASVRKCVRCSMSACMALLTLLRRSRRSRRTLSAPRKVSRYSSRCFGHRPTRVTVNHVSRWRRPSPTRGHSSQAHLMTPRRPRSCTNMMRTNS